MTKTKADLGAGLSLAVKQPYPVARPVQHGPTSQISSFLALGSYFISGVMAINASQFLGVPLYLVNRDWYNAWIAFTKQSFGLLTMTMTQWWAPTVMRISGDKTVRGQLLKTVDGRLICNFPERAILIANHQIYTDWLYLWWIAYTNGMHGRIYIVLKESLKRIPVIGWGIQFSQFILLKRNWEKDKPHLAAHLQTLNKASDPMWLLLFPEGTNLAPSTRDSSRKWAAKKGIPDMRHQLIPRSTGLQFCLQELRKTVDYIYDCTIAYEGVPRGEYAQDIFTVKASYLEGRPPKSVNMYWRRFAISAIPIDDSEAFEYWLRQRWIEKDKLIELYYRTGRFPADVGVEKAPDGTTRRGAGHIETEVKAFHWYEFLQIFAPIGLFALVLYTFYGSLPKTFVKAINKTSAKAKIGGTQKKQLKGPKQPKLLMPPPSKAPPSKKPTALKKVVPKPAVKKVTPTKAPSKAVASQKLPTKVTNVQKVPSKLAVAPKDPPKPSTAPKLPSTGADTQKPSVAKAPAQKVPLPATKKQQTTAGPKKTEPTKLPAKNQIKPLANGTAQAPKKLDTKPKASPVVKKLPTTPQAPKKLAPKT